ncbi:MAG: hypothetical protein LBG46_03360 [Elusimicrobiota bacterium]|jgi:hypothetical protein|nr:hypothetical protein [Elusimicrobiota bacterium]
MTTKAGAKLHMSRRARNSQTGRIAALCFTPGAMTARAWRRKDNAENVTIEIQR